LRTRLLGWYVRFILHLLLIARPGRTRVQADGPLPGFAAPEFEGSPLGSPGTEVNRRQPGKSPGMRWKSAPREAVRGSRLVSIGATAYGPTLS
jgi:hypothetical protein